jgi:hypothetical protein
MDTRNLRSSAAVHVTGRVRNPGYEIILLVGAVYWLGAAWVAFDLRMPLHSRIVRSIPVAERLLFGCAALAASGLLLRSRGRYGKTGSRSWLLTDLAALRRAVCAPQWRRACAGPAAPSNIGKAK